MWMWVSVALSLLGVWVWMRERQLRQKAELELGHVRKDAERIPSLEEQLKCTEQELAKSHSDVRIVEEKLQMLTHAEEQLKNVFRALSSEALEKNNRNFMDLAKVTLEKYQEGAKGDLEKRQEAIGSLLTPMKETLQKLDQGIQHVEKERKGEQEVLREQMRRLLENEKQLKQETSNLVKALRTPLARGRWGEIQLKRVLEMSGMLNHCDFYEQQQEMGEEGRLRPDVVVRLPGGRQVIIDAKVPLEAYLEAVQSSDEDSRQNYLKNHAAQVRAHVMALSKKAYWERFQPSPEFVVLFLPAETFFSAALEFEPSLIEVGVEKRVIIATPTTLIALLRAVAYGWQQETLTRHVETLHVLGQELYKRLSDMSQHFAKVGRGLNSAVESYNKGIGSFESRVLVTARKFQELGVVSGSIEIEELEPVEKIAREPLVLEESN